MIEEPAEDPAAYYQQIGQDFVDGAPAGWVLGTVIYRRAGKTAEYLSWATMSDGSQVGTEVPRTSAEAFKALRGLTYRPGQGAWWTATATLHTGGRFSLDYDYDHEPDWATGTAPGHYQEDIEVYPRDPEHTPDWLRERLAQAAARSAETGTRPQTWGDAGQH